MDPIKKPGVDSGAPEEWGISASCRTPAILPMSNSVWGRDNIKVTGPFAFGKRVLYARQILTGRIIVYKCLSVRRKHVASYLDNAWCELIQTSHSSLLWWYYGVNNILWNIDFSFQSNGTSLVKLKAIFHMANSNFTSKLWSLHFPILEYRCKCTRDGRIMRL